MAGLAQAQLEASLADHAFLETDLLSDPEVVLVLALGAAGGRGLVSALGEQPQSLGGPEQVLRWGQAVQHVEQAGEMLGGQLAGGVQVQGQPRLGLGVALPEQLGALAVLGVLNHNMIWLEGMLALLSILSAFTYVLRTDPSLPLFLAMFLLWRRNEAQRYRLTVLLVAFIAYDVLWVIIWFLYGHDPDIFTAGRTWMIVLPVYVAMAELAGKMVLLAYALCSEEHAARNFFGFRLSLLFEEEPPK